MHLQFIIRKILGQNISVKQINHTFSFHSLPDPRSRRESIGQITNQFQADENARFRTQPNGLHAGRGNCGSDVLVLHCKLIFHFLFLVQFSSLGVSLRKLFD